MATLHPSLHTFTPTSAGAYRERDILQILQDGLPQGFDVYHSVNFSAVHSGTQTFGEVDAVVLTPNGHLVLLEVKAGEVSATAQGISKLYANQHGNAKDIAHQAQRQHAILLGKIRDAGYPQVHVAHMLVLPDQKIAAGSVGYPRERIVDATQMDSLCSLIRAASPTTMLPDATRQWVMDFLTNRFAVFPDPSTHMGQVARVSTALAEGLATWVPRITHSNGVFVVEATAGSGKTQLALALLRTAVQSGQRAAYVCFNRPLADHMVQVVPHQVEVSTFHEYAVMFAKSQGVPVDFGQAGVFDQVTQHLLAHDDTQTARLDLLVIDESQDFDPAWVQALLPRLKEGGRLYVLGDSHQQLYARDAFELEGAVLIQCDDNFRSPRKVVDAINQLRLTHTPVLARSAHQGQAPGFHTYDPAIDVGGLKALQKCLAQLWQEGFGTVDVAVLSFAGRGRSHITPLQSLAGLSTRRFTGQYDAAGNPLWTDGDLLLETVYRFKGQSAPVVVLCEVDFETLTERELHKLFVGFTRAQFRLEVVLSENAAVRLLERG